MELVSLENGRMVSLFTIRAERGQPYVPNLIAAVASRYSFVRFPESFDEMAGEVRKFEIGDFSGNQIREMSVYNDGLIVDAPNPTDMLEDFVHDLTGFCSTEFGMEISETPAKVNLFESILVVKFDSNMEKRLGFLEFVASQLALHQRQYGVGRVKYEFSGVSVDVDSAKYAGRRTGGFAIERRANVSYDANVWFCRAPLKTNDHLKLLRELDVES